MPNNENSILQMTTSFNCTSNVSFTVGCSIGYFYDRESGGENRNFNVPNLWKMFWREHIFTNLRKIIRKACKN